jgi:ABC-type branched-subunit amino acid transport system substrate-binding protein
MPSKPHGIEFDPVKIGFLLDWEVGVLDNFLQPFQLAFEEAYERGITNRRIELVVEKAIGLPRHAAINVRRGLQNLIDQGCVGVIGPLISDNAIVLVPEVNARQIPALTWAGTERYHGEYCFNLGNGGCGEEGQLMASWLKRRGHTRIGVFNELSPNGEEYFQYFRWACDALGLKIVRLETITQTPDDLEASVVALRESKCDALAYMGFGYPTILMGPIFQKLGWNPPRIMTTAIQFCYARPEWMAALEGWVGIDQYCEENPLVEPFLDRFEKRFGRRPHTNTVVTLAYDTARVYAEATRRAPVLTGPGIKAGLERIRFMTSTTGGPRTHIGAGPYDHKLFKGDWLLYRRIEGGKTVFEGTFEPPR